MTEKRLAISLPAKQVGELVQSRHGMTRWLPDADWEREGQMPRLGLDFLRRRGPRSHASELPTWFENLLPERGSKLRLRLAGAFGLREGQSFALLAHVGGDLLGAVEARPSNGATSERAQGAPMQDIEPAVGPTQGATRRHSALTGMQVKFSMSMVHDRLTLAAQGRGAQWIVKLPGPEYPELAEIEAATMTWARHCGFDVPDHFVAPFDQLDGIPAGWAETAAPVFAVRRFDRREDGTKIHQEDLCQALDVRPMNKYGSEPPRVGFDGVLRLVHDTCGEQDARELARRIGFMIACGNTDAHLKNWGLLWGDRPRPTLAPCYDLVATIAWENLGWTRPRGPELALELGGESRFVRLGRRQLEELAAQTQYPWVEEEVLGGITRSLQSWPEVAAQAPARMRDALTAHWDEVPLLRLMRSVEVPR